MNNNLSGEPIAVNPAKLALVYGRVLITFKGFLLRFSDHLNKEGTIMKLIKQINLLAQKHNWKEPGQYDMWPNFNA